MAKGGTRAQSTTSRYVARLRNRAGGLTALTGRARANRTANRRRRRRVRAARRAARVAGR